MYYIAISWPKEKQHTVEYAWKQKKGEKKNHFFDLSDLQW